MAKLYRIERDDRYCGLYGAPSSIHLFDAWRHPSPTRDSLLCRNVPCGGEFDYGVYIWGFASIDQMNRWIYSNDIKEDLDKEGFVINVYDTEEVYVGYTQAVIMCADHREDKIVQCIKLTECLA